MALTKEDVIQAANDLAQKGIRPTNALVREHLGAGSYTTINAGLKLWREQQKQKQMAEFQDLKINLEQLINLQAIAGIARDFARRETEAEREILQQQGKQIEQELHATGIKIDDLEADLTQVRQENREQKDRIADQQKQIAKIEERLDAMAVKERTLVQRIDKAVEARAEAERKLMACEEEKKLLQEQIAVQREELEFADEKAKDTEAIFGRFLKRIQQAARLVDRLKYDTSRNEQRQEALQRVVMEAEALAGRCYVGGIPKPK